MAKAVFKRMKLPEATIQMIGEKVPETVERIESLNSSKAQQVYRVKFKDLDPHAFIVSDEVEKGKAKFYHYCEKNEKNSQCTHLVLGAAIADKVGFQVEKASFGFDIAGIEVLPFPKEDKEYSSMNSLFELLEPVEEEPSTSSTAPAAAVPASPSIPGPGLKRNWKAGWNEIQEHLQNEGLSTRMISKLQARRAEIHTTVGLRPMTIEPQKPNFPYQGEMLARSLRHILKGKDLLLIGNKGSGKDTLINTISWILGLPMTVYVGNKDETKESLVGEPAFRNGESTFDPSEFAKVIEYGGIVNMAEINMLVGDVTSILHSVADENRVLATPIGSIHRHDHSVIVGSMNVGEGYQGVKELNDALKDRFAILRLPYTTDFKQLIEKKTGLDDLHALMFLEKVKNAISKLISEESQGHAADTLRGYIDAAKYFCDYGVNNDTKIEVIEDYIINKIEDLDEYMSARDMIRTEAWKDFPTSKEEEEYMKGAM